MKIFRNVCSGIGLFSIVGGILFFIGWLFYSLNKLGVTALTLGICSLFDLLRYYL